MKEKGECWYGCGLEQRLRVDMKEEGECWYGQGLEQSPSTGWYERGGLARLRADAEANG